jgi:hypothetical protein
MASTPGNKTKDDPQVFDDESTKTCRDGTSNQRPKL